MAFLSPAFAMNRFGLGPRPGDLERISADPRAAILSELDTADIDLKNDSLRASFEIFLEIGHYHPDPAEMSAKGVPAARDPTKLPYAIAYANEIAARIEQTRAVEIGFVERLVAFWMNHFTVAARANGYTQGLVGSFEREAIRPNVLGKFADMLFAATRHPAMLLYLNNAQSVGPNSKVGLRRNSGLNENHARELLELHTVGVDAGYSQADVTSLARVLTGWTVNRNQNQPEICGRYFFAPGWHEPGAQTVMGVRYDEGGEDQGRAVLLDLARDPSTAQHIAKKFVRHFVADNPPAELVEGLASTFEGTGGDLRAMTLGLVNSETAWQPTGKFKTPQEFVWSALRALSIDIDAPFVKKVLVDLGQPIFNAPSPQGFSDDSSEWLAPDAITNRLDVATQLAARAPVDADPNDIARAVLGPLASQDTMTTIAKAGSRTQALALLMMSPEFQRR